MFFARPFSVLATLALAATTVVPSAALADDGVPSYASHDQRISGRVYSFDGHFNLQIRDDNGYVDAVRLHDGTVINPTGLTLSAGQSVTVLGYNAGSYFDANEIDTPYDESPGPGYDAGYDAGYVGYGGYGGYPYYGGYYGGYGCCYGAFGPFGYGLGFSVGFGIGYFGGWGGYGWGHGWNGYGWGHGGYGYGGYGYGHGGYGYGGYGYYGFGGYGGGGYYAYSAAVA